MWVAALTSNEVLRTGFQIDVCMYVIDHSSLGLFEYEEL